MSARLDAVDTMWGLAVAIGSAGTRGGSKRFNATSATLRQLWADVAPQIPASEVKADAARWVHMEHEDTADMRLAGEALHRLRYWIEGWEAAEARIHPAEPA